MKKLFYIIVSVIFVTTINAQETTTLYNGEDVVDGWAYLEGNPPNGSFFENGALKEGGKMDVHAVSVANPLKNDVNNTDYAVRSVRGKDGANWFGAGIGDLNIDMSEVKNISMLIKKEVIGNSALEVQRTGEGNQTLFAWYGEDDLGEWRKLVVDIEGNDNVNFGMLHTIYVHLHHAEPDFATNTIIYWDEVTVHYKDGTSQVVFNGESDPTFYSGWDTYGAMNNVFTPQFINLLPSETNSSDNVLRFLRGKDGEGWCAINKAIDGLDFSNNTEYEVSLKINKPVAGKVAVKLEGNETVGVEKTIDYTATNTWQEISIRFSATDFPENAPNAILVFPHAEATSAEGNNLADHTAIYLDDIKIIKKTTGISTIYPSVSTEQLIPVSYKLFSTTGAYVGDDENLLPDGIYLKRNIYENGQSETVKVYIKK